MGPGGQRAEEGKGKPGARAGLPVGPRERDRGGERESRGRRNWALVLQEIEPSMTFFT